jgi:putative MATE family efflux protein
MSGVNIVAQVGQVVTGIAFGFLSGTTVIVAQYLGAGKQEAQKKAIETSFAFIFWLAVISTISLLVLTDPLLRLLQTPAECYREARNYYVIYMAGTLFVFFYNAISSVLRGLGDSRNPLYFVIISTVLNILLDLVFVGPLKMGAAGAALATILSQAASILLAVLHLRKIDFSFDFKPGSFRIDREQLKLLFSLGTPVALQETALNVSLVFLVAAANSLGVYESAAVGIGSKINVIFILPVCALNVALATMVGQNIGAGKMERAMQATKLEFFYSALYSAVICAVMWIFSKELMMIFTDDPQTLAVGANYFKGHCWDYLLVMPFGYCFGGLFLGTGHSSYVAISNGVGALLARIPLSFLLARYLGVVGLGLAYPISTLFTDLAYFWFYFKGDWKQSAITPKS